MTQRKPIRLIQVTDTHLFNRQSGELCGLNTLASAREVLREVKKVRPKPGFYLATGDLAQDESRKLSDQVQSATDDAVKEIDAVVAAKEQEIMQV